MIAIRWLGAFGRGASLDDSLEWELSAADREVAAEWFGDNIPVSDSGINHCQIGLLLDRNTIRRHYNGDVWSVARGPRLRATRCESVSCGHTECFCIPRYRGIVCRRPLDQLAPWVRRTVIAAARRHDLPIYIIDRKGGNYGRLKKVVVPDPAPSIAELREQAEAAMNLCYKQDNMAAHARIERALHGLEDAMFRGVPTRNFAHNLQAAINAAKGV